jgi:uncharacterized membrane protein
MVPPFVPFPWLTVYVTGGLELLGALGLVLDRTRAAAGWCLAALFACLLPANVHAAAAGVPLVDVPLWFRIPEQLAYLAVAVAAAKSRRRGGAPRIPRYRRAPTFSAAARTRGRKVKPLGLSVKDSTMRSSYSGSTSKS